MPGIIPIVVGLVAAGAVAFAFGDKHAAAAPGPRPKQKSPEVSDATEAVIIEAMGNPQAMKRLIDAAAATGDAPKLWNLGRTILINSQGNPTMQAVASQVLVNAVVTATKKGQLGDLMATVLANGDTGIFIGAAQSAIGLNPELSGRLNVAIEQLRRATQPPTQSPGQPRPPVTSDEKLDTKAAETATAVIADAIKKTEEVQKAPAQAPLPANNVTTLPEIVITASPPGKSTSQVLDAATTAAMQLTDYLHSISDSLPFPHMARFKEDKSKVGQAQVKLGVTADGKYGPGSAKRIASLGVVPIPPFYWPKAWQNSKREYASHIKAMVLKFPDLDFGPAMKGVDRS